MSIDIVQNPAKDINVSLQSTFEKWAAEVSKESKSPIRYGDGTLIKLHEGSHYSVLALELEQIATPEQFQALMGIIMQGVTQAVQAGVISPTFFRGITTLMNLHPPVVPTEYKAGVTEGTTFDVNLIGDCRYVVTKNLPEVIINKDEENG